MRHPSLLACCALLGACAPGGGSAPAAVLPPLPRGLLLGPEDWARIPRAGRDPGCEAGTPCARAWANLLTWAERWDDAALFPDLTEAIEKDNDHDVVALACALAWRGSDDDAWRERAREMLEQAVFTPYSTAGRSALEPGRNLLSYVLAASTIELDALDPFLDGAFRVWIEQVCEIDLWSGDGVSAGTFRAYQEARPNNVGLVIGASRIAVEMYLGGPVHAAHLVEAQRICRGFLGDDTAFNYPDGAFGGGREDNSWQLDPRPGQKEGIGPPGAVIPLGPGFDVDGCLPEEMRRLGDVGCASCGLAPSVLCYNRADALDGGVPPGMSASGYAWEALQGLVMQAYLLQRCGYDAFAWGDAALERTHRFLYLTYGLRAQDTWHDATQADDPGCCDGVSDRTQVDDTWVPHVVRALTGAEFLDDETLVFGGRPGKCCGFADWWILGFAGSAGAGR